jgi:preprotein translocase subunit SecY
LLNAPRHTGAHNLAQSAVSAGIAALEERHGTKLFHRVRRGIELTEAGTLFLVETPVLWIPICALFSGSKKRSRQVGNRMFEGQSSHLPLQLNTSGVIPPIFASSLLLLPTTIANFTAGQGPGWLTAITTQLAHGRPLFLLLYVGLIVFFAFFYTAIVFNPTETADNLKKHGGFISGIRPGERTAEYIDYVF